VASHCRSPLCVRAKRINFGLSFLKPQEIIYRKNVTLAGFKQTGEKEIICITQKENTRSCKLLKKLGMKHVKDFEQSTISKILKWGSCYEY
jgi:hypothetical protein